MSSSRRIHLAVLAASALSIAALSRAEPTTQASQQDLNEKINSLQAQIDQLRSQQSTLRQEQREATFQNVLDDADRHSKLLQTNDINAGYTDGKFLLRSEDGNFLLHPWLQFQFRNITDYREDVKAKATRDDIQNGFEVRRLKFGADGNLFGPDLTYMFQFAVDRHTGNVQLEMAWAKYHFAGTPFYARAGQFKDPVDHEQLAASRYFPAADRSFIDDTFLNGEGFIKGASVIFDPGDVVRGEAAFTGGLRNFNTNFLQFPNAGIPTSWGAAARAEYKAFGNWKDYDLITAYGAKAETLVIGGGVDYTETGHSDALVHVVDAQFQTRNGLSFYGAYLGRYSTHIGKKSVDAYDPTARFQVSWAIDNHWEPYGRYEYVHFNAKELAAGSTTNVQVITAGVNYYLYGFAAKVTADLSYLPSGAPVNDDGFGILTDNHHNELVGRVQLQVVL